MRTVEIKLYKIDELSKEVQDKVIEKRRFINIELGDWTDFIIENWKSKLEGMGFEDARIEWSGFGSQGDGASFTGRITDQEDLIKLMDGIDKDKFKPLKDAINKEDVELYANTTELDRRYSHEYTKRLDLELSELIDIDPELYSILLNLTEELESALEARRVNLCKEIYKDLEKEYDSLISDEAVKDTLSINGFEFTESGKFFKG